tara:strand:+ start:118 stop:1143 length:1026 start_codon:yes stop_codon:yes gene_type:complete
MKKVFITGGAGFIGYNCSIFFLKKGFKVKIFDNLSRKTSLINFKKLKNEKKIICENGSLTNFSKLKKSILGFKPNLIINCAGQVAVTTSIKNPKLDFESNVIGTFNLLEIIRESHLKTKFIHLSTNKVYGDLTKANIKLKGNRYEFVDHKKGIDENFQLDFQSPYGCSKGASDQYVIDYKRIFNLDTYVVRQSCIYGPHQYGLEDQGWVSWMTICSILSKRITIFGNGKQVRDLLYIDDLVQLFYQIYINKKKLKTNYFNCGGGNKNSLSIIELCKILKTINKKNLLVKFKKERKSDQKIFISNNTLLQKNFSWKPETNKLKGIKLLHKWISSNLEQINKI